MINLEGEFTYFIALFQVPKMGMEIEKQWTRL